MLLSTLAPCSLPRSLPRSPRLFPHPQIQERLRLPDDDVQRLLHSLACSKYKIIKKDPESKSISKTDKFRCAQACTRGADFGGMAPPHSRPSLIIT